jgi:hypothetical protein
MYFSLNFRRKLNNAVLVNKHLRHIRLQRPFLFTMRPHQPVTYKRFKRKKASKFALRGFLVGVAGFEPTTSTSQMWRDTGLRYTPNWCCPTYEFAFSRCLGLQK